MLIVSEFAVRNRISEADAYAYLGNYGALALCEKHYGVMHTLSVEENIDSLIEYCRRKDRLPASSKDIFHSTNSSIESNT